MADKKKGTSEKGYVPGVCNIGPAERRARRISGWTGLIITVVLWVLFVAFDTIPALRLLIFFPAFMSALGFLQSAFHFCVAFGLRGLFNFGSKVGDTETVEEAKAKKLDRKRAWQIILVAFVTSSVIALTAYVIRFS